MIILLIACSQSTLRDQSADTAEPWWVLEPTMPAWSADEVAARIQEQASAGLPTPGPFEAAYAAAHTHATADCPGTDGQIAQPEGCTTGSGWFYSGVAHYHTSADNLSILADMEIVSPDGLRMWGGGSIGHSLFVEKNDTTSWWVEVTGSWGWQGGEGWMTEGVSALLSIHGASGSDLMVVNVSGSLEDAGRAMSFDLLWDQQTCWAGAGTVRVRDPDSGWYHLELHCGGCGTVAHDDTDTTLGEACVDLSPMRDQAAGLAVL